MVLLVAGMVSGQDTRRLTIDRLYSLPRLIGTAPRGFTFSPDSRKLAFLWNDEGTNFYDVWAIEVAYPQPLRLTRMPRSSGDLSVNPASGPLEDMKVAVRAERDPGVTAVAWHPDSDRVLFTFRGDLYLTLSQPASDEIKRLTETPASESRAGFSPDGRYLSFLSEGSLWLAELETLDETPPQKWTGSLNHEVSIESYRWSPDSRTIAFVEVDRRSVPIRSIPDYLEPETVLVPFRRPFPGEEPPNRRLGVVSVSTEVGEPQWLEIGGRPEEPIFSYRWSPDGRRLLVDRSDLYVKDRRLVVLQVEEGTRQEIYREAEALNVSAYWQAEWAPDGRGVYFLSDRDEDYHVYLLPEPGAQPRRITHGNGAVSRFHVSADARALFFVANTPRPEERHFYQVGLNGGEAVRLSRQGGTHTPVFSPDGRHAAVLFSSDHMPPELLLTSLEAGASEPAVETEQRITRSPILEFQEYQWIQPLYVTFESQVDEVTLHGRLFVPPGLDENKKYPAILGSTYSNTVRNQWGGRTAHPTWGLDQFLVQEGYVLLNVDIRGSWGHGKDFRRGIRLDYGGIDVEDLASGVRYLDSLGYVDMDRVGIWGSSYGGLLACMSLFKKPGMYKAGVAAAPATNVWHALTGEMRVMMAPEDQPTEYMKASAFAHAAGLRDHLMILHGMNDRVVLFKDSVLLVERLMMLRKDVDFVALPDGGHAWDREGLYQTVFAFKKLVGHFERYMGKGPR
jgi:dipeptidyl-peptidase-4